MNCQEAQSNLVNYVNQTMDHAATKLFIDHICTCEECHEELEIYYIITKGMWQLDHGEVLTTDFQKELTRDMEKRYRDIEREENRSHIIKWFIFLLAFGAVLGIIAELFIILGG